MHSILFLILFLPVSQLTKRAAVCPHLYTDSPTPFASFLFQYSLLHPMLLSQSSLSLNVHGRLLSLLASHLLSLSLSLTYFPYFLGSPPGVCCSVQSSLSLPHSFSPLFAAYASPVLPEMVANFQSYFHFSLSLYHSLVHLWILS